MNFFKNMGITSKVILSVLIVIMFVAVVIILFGGYREYEKTKKAARHEAKAILLQGEAVREMIANLNSKGAFNAYLDEIKKKIKSDNIEDKQKAIADFLDTVPVVSSIYMLSKNAEKGGYVLRVPKIMPRNPANTPSPIELKALNELKTKGLEELTIYSDFNDPKTGKVRPVLRYFRPIVLTKECELCHGDPSLSRELWGNDEGLDPTGARMEGWKAGEIHGAFEIIYYLDVPMKEMLKNQAVVAGLILVGMLLVVFFVSLAIKILVKRPLDALIVQAERMARGDLSGSVDIGSNDEMGRFGAAFKAMQQGLIRLISSTKTSATDVDDSSNSLLNVSDEMYSQTQNATESAREAAEITQQASHNIESIASAVEDFSIASQEIATNVSQAASISNNAREQMENSSQFVEKLGSSSQEIGRAIKLISDIAEQTNLLALNATIEAARAGEAGKGFAVVANEVKELAKQTAQAAEDITGMINTIQADSNSAVNAIGEVRQIIEQLNDINNTIASAVEEQTATVNEITENISNAANSTKEVSDIVANVAEVNENASSSAMHTKEQAERLASLANELSAVVASFKV